MREQKDLCQTARAARDLRCIPIITLLFAVSGTTCAQTLTTLFDFASSALGSALTGTTDGAFPEALTVGPDGNLYGTTDAGSVPLSAWPFPLGTIFEITPTGTMTTLHSFTGQDSVGGGGPLAGLTLGPDGNFYGTNASGGPSNHGGIFRVTPTGSLTTLFWFNGADGSSPETLTLGPDGNFYGTTEGGGGYNHGTIFRVTPAGTLTMLYSFGGATGALPSSPYAGLTLGRDGNFYGTTSGGGQLGGASNYGTIFEITPAGTLTTLHTFSGADGSSPESALTLGLDGNLYGATQLGGANNYGTIFKITPVGTLTTLHNFGVTDGRSPEAALTLGPDGNFYGTTQLGGANNYGTIFKITPAGTLTTIHSFNGTDGWSPEAALTLGPDGSFYGTTQLGGAKSGGTIFRLSLGNGPLTISTNGVVNAATYSAPVAPGSIAAVFGVFPTLNPTPETTFPIPTAISGLSLQFGSATLAPLLFASQSQLNVQVPWELAGLAQTSVSLSQNGEASATQPAPLATYAPGIFVVDSQTEQGAVLDASYNLIGPTNPAAPGADVQIYCTGLGPVTDRPATGAPALADPLSWTTTTPTVTIGGAPAAVLFSGLAPGFVGLYQVTVQVPAGAAKGSNASLAISIGGTASNTVLLAIQKGVSPRSRSGSRRA